MTETTVACCQLELPAGDPAGNRATVDAAVRDAAARGAQVVVLPELASSGYAFTGAAEASALAEPLDGPTVAAWAALAAELELVLVGGLCERADDGRLHNTAVLVGPSGLCAAYRKVHLWDREKGIFAPGEAAPPVVETEVGRIGVVVCYDLEFPEWMRLPALAGAELICAPVSWPRQPTPPGERPMEVVRVQAAAAANRVFVAACDRAGPERDVEWTGASVIVDPDGWPLAGPLAGPRPGTVLASCRLSDARDKAISDANDVHSDRLPELYQRASPTIQRTEST